MKFNVKRTQIEVVQEGDYFFVESWGRLEPLIYDTYKFLTLKQLKAIFTPADLESLDLVEPDRNEKICEESGKQDPNYYKGE